MSSTVYFYLQQYFKKMCGSTLQRGPGLVWSAGVNACILWGLPRERLSPRCSHCELSKNRAHLNNRGFSAWCNPGLLQSTWPAMLSPAQIDLTINCCGH